MGYAGVTLKTLADTAHSLVGCGKGLLAMDESNATCDKCFAALNIPQTEAFRRDWRDLIVTTRGLGDNISGAILYDETIHQRKKDGTPFVRVLEDAGIIPGIIVLLFGSGVVVWGNNSKNSLQHNPPHSIEEISAE